MVPLPIQPHSHVKPVEAQSNKPEPKMSWVIVTPQMATEWLERNTLNRSVRDSLVKELSRDMLAGRWRGYNGEAIRFDTEGRLVDGQHRLWAAIEGPCSFKTLVVTGIDPDDYDTIGIGRKKSFADFMRQEKNRTLLASTVRLAFLWETNRLSGELTARSATTATIKELQETLEACPLIREAVNRVSSAYTSLKGLLSQSYASLLYYAALKNGQKDKIEQFLNGVRDGLNLDQTSPVYHLRKQMLSNQASRSKIPGPYMLALAIKGWNMFIADRKVLQLRFKADEAFPILANPEKK